MMYSATCKAGKIQITDDGTLQIAQIFGKVLWQAPAQAVTDLAPQAGTLNLINVTIRAGSHGSYTAESMTPANYEKLRALFPGLSVRAIAGKEWYCSPGLLTYVATYTKEKAMQREVQTAGQYGWMPQTSAGVAGHINVGRTATAAALTGGASLLFGASRSRDKIVLTFVRTPEWLAQNQR